MNDDYKKEILLKLIKAPNIEEVTKLIDTEEFFKKGNWVPYGGVENNFGQISALAKTSDKAIVEKISNSIDAMLIKACYESGLNPESPDAPNNMREAAEKFFKIKKGDISTLDDKRTRELATKILVIAEGDREKPNISVIDFGEGQHPIKFRDTLLSLNRGNKMKIKFTQGKYNMGGAAVLRFCENGYQLILARRPKSLLNGEEDLWGFTLVRKNSSPGFRVAWYEHFVDENGKVPTIRSCPLKIIPDGRDFEFGCYIKMYEYFLESPSLIVASSGESLFSKLNRRFFQMALPVMVIERRYSKIKEAKNYQFLKGNRTRIYKEDNIWIEDKGIGVITAQLGEFGKKNIEWVLFKTNVDEQQFVKNRFTTDQEAIFLTVNGQTHWALPKSIISGKLEFPFLKDYLLVHIDLTDTGHLVNEIFSGNRDDIVRNASYIALEKRLIDELKNDKTLFELNKRYQEKAIIGAVEKNKVQKILTKLINKNPQIARLLGLGLDLLVRDKRTDRPEVANISFVSSYTPTYLRIKKFEPKNEVDVFKKDLPVNSYIWIFLETDAPNDYTSREKDTGDWKILSSDSVQIGGLKLEDGIVPMRVYSTDKSKVGKTEDVEIELTRPNNPSLKVKFRINFISEIKKEIKPSGTTNPKIEKYNMPDIRPIKQYQWGNEWTEEDVAKVNKSGGKFVVQVNMDCRQHREFKNSYPNASSIEERIDNLFMWSIGLIAIGVYNSFEKNGYAPDFDKDKVVGESMKGVADIILPIIFSSDIIGSIES